MSAIPVRVHQLTTSFERGVVRIYNTWGPYCVLSGRSATAVVRVRSPRRTVVPLYEQQGAVSRELALTALSKAAQEEGIVPDMLVVELKTPWRVQGYGMVAVPRGHKPTFFVERG